MATIGLAQYRELVWRLMQPVADGELPPGVTLTFENGAILIQAPLGAHVSRFGRPPLMRFRRHALEGGLKAQLADLQAALGLDLAERSRTRELLKVINQAGVDSNRNRWRHDGSDVLGGVDDRDLEELATGMYADIKTWGP